MDEAPLNITVVKLGERDDDEVVAHLRVHFINALDKSLTLDSTHSGQNEHSGQNALVKTTRTQRLRDSECTGEMAHASLITFSRGVASSSFHPRIISPPTIPPPCLHQTSKSSNCTRPIFPLLST